MTLAQLKNMPSTGQEITNPVFLEQLKTLNPAQRQAIELTEGPLLVLAGAGTGKTRVLTTRLSALLLSHKAWPSQVLAVTFTNKAALEMRERVASLIGGPAEGLWLGTFHSVCVRILRRHAELLGLQSSFTILDTDDQLRLIKQIIKAEGIDDKKFPPRVLASIISRWKDRALPPEKVSSPASDFEKAAFHVYKIYQDRLKVLNAVDFGDLILLCLKLFTEHSDVLAQYTTQFHYILVDEYQDTNVAQYLWLRLLAQGSGNICCVGDDDQSIYGWRGAEVGNILRFEKDFPGATIIRLEQNYRSNAHILGAASGLIAQNASRFGKTLWTEQDGGEKIRIQGIWDGEEEARVVADEIESLHRKGNSLNQMAILVRAGFQTREFEERFITLGVPYRVIGGPRFYERLEIRDALAYMRIVIQPNDSLAFERIVNTPKRGIGTSTLQVLHQYARYEEVSLTEATLRLMETDEIRGKAKTALQGILYDIDRWRKQLNTLEPGELARLILDESGYTGMWQADKSPEAPGRLENLKEFVNAIDEFESLGNFLEHVSLVMENTRGTGSDMVSIMTLHSAKGLEFDSVFLAGWEEGLFPHQRALGETGKAGLEEERRLAYVGLTRARQRAMITFAANRRVHNQWQSSFPSRFIDELPIEHTERLNVGGNHAFVRRIPQTKLQVLKEPSHPLKENSFRLRQRVFHIKFGYGHIIALEGDKLEINFDHTGIKKVMKSFVETTE
ncbi:MAG: UvrD-helicase domain-containing protein [Alphaproteobacteria bacterium]|nr:UvrD-helicase domain-containing protein [Alphaproteobacteria bacterium]